MKKSFYDNFFTGILAGLVLLVLSFYLVLLIHKSALGFTERPVSDFYNYLTDSEVGRSQIIPKLLSLAAIPELLLFFVFIWTNKLKSARGVIGSAFLLGVVIIILKYT